MRKITTTNKVLTITILVLTVLFIFTKNKIWNYKQTQSIEYNKQYNEKNPVIDTIYGLYKNTNPILVRSGFKINGHDKIGVCTGGSQLWFECDDNCKKCLKIRNFVIDEHSLSGEINGKCSDFFLSLLRDR